jgi:hypothetical protein
MSKRSIQIQETLYGGIDVSATTLTVAVQRAGQPVEQSSSQQTEWSHLAAESQITGSSVVGSDGSLLSRPRVCT